MCAVAQRIVRAGAEGTMDVAGRAPMRAHFPIPAVEEGPRTSVGTTTATPTPNPAARVELGDQARLYGGAESAFAEFQRAFESSPDDEVSYAARLGIARTHFLSGELDEAQVGWYRLVRDEDTGWKLICSSTAVSESSGHHGLTEDSPDPGVTQQEIGIHRTQHCRGASMVLVEPPSLQ